MIGVLCGCPGPGGGPKADGGTSVSGTSTTTSDSTSTGTDGTSTGTDGTTGESSERKLDVLVVIDNSETMAPRQLALANAFPALLGALADSSIDARFGFTTTDNGNPLCGQATTPEGGALVLSSCRERLEDFIADAGADYGGFACESICEYEQPITTKPTMIDNGGEAKPRPWLEVNANETNLVDDLQPADAIKCLLPQGVDGCSFEQPLESMHKALLRTEDEQEASFGFLRDDATLLVLVVTDEADCSYSVPWNDIFLPGGGKLFWQDMGSDIPTSAICWNAGTRCVPDMDVLDCTVADYDIGGMLLDPEAMNTPAEAVLHPVGRYTAELDKLVEAKGESEGQVLVALIAGLGEDSQPFYDETNDQELMNEFGIGPGCEQMSVSTECVLPSDCPSKKCEDNVCVELGIAIPPVRLLHVAERYGAGQLYSVCSDDWSDYLKQIGEAVAE